MSTRTENVFRREAAGRVRTDEAQSHATQAPLMGSKGKGLLGQHYGRVEDTFLAAP